VTPLQELHVILDHLREHARFQRELGVTHLWNKSSALPPSPTLDTIRHELGDCQRCALGKTRHHLVFGEGNPSATLMFVGEAPGRDEDLQGRPFVGRAGELLTKIISAIGLHREDVYIANILKCRPPDNRDPRPEEVAVCCPFLLKQIEAINPRLIVALGKFAAHTLLHTNQKISQLRGRFYVYGDAMLMPTYHPASLLRNPGFKKAVWDDMKMVRDEYKKVTRSLRRS